MVSYHLNRHLKILEYFLCFPFLCGPYQKNLLLQVPVITFTKYNTYIYNTLSMKSYTISQTKKTRKTDLFFDVTCFRRQDKLPILHLPPPSPIPPPPGPQILNRQKFKALSGYELINLTSLVSRFLRKVT